MIRKFNYTGRKKIDQSRIQISLITDDAGVRSFNANLNFEDLGFPENSKIYIEPYYKSSFMRFYYGTIDEIKIPSNRIINEIPNSDIVLFRVKIVDESKAHGRLLGLAQGIRPIELNKDEAGRKSILWVDFEKDLDHLIWRVSFDHEMPTLEVNNRLENRRDLIKSNGAFFSLVYPAVIREIISKIAFDEVDYDAQGDDWQNIWLKYLYSGLGIHKKPKYEANNDEDVLTWVDDTIALFCSKYQTRNRFELSKILK